MLCRVCQLGNHTPAHCPKRHIGKLVGEYTLRDLRGIGGMGAVFEATNTKAEQVAVKIGSANASEERLVQEATRQFAHDNLVKIFGGGIHPEIGAYVVMELLSGETLAARLARGKISWMEATRIIRAVLCGLAALHQASIVHRDIKPSNIFLLSDGRGVKILDLGIAKANPNEMDNSVTRTGELIGAIQYCPLEAFDSKYQVLPSRDIWAVGAVAYYLISGRRFLEAKDPFQYREALRRGFVGSSIRTLDITPKPPQWVSDFVEKCLAQNPSERPQTGDEALAMLDGLSARTRAPEALTVSDAMPPMTPLLASQTQADPSGLSPMGPKGTVTSATTSHSHEDAGDATVPPLVYEGISKETIARSGIQQANFPAPNDALSQNTEMPNNTAATPSINPSYKVLRNTAIVSLITIVAAWVVHAFIWWPHADDANVTAGLPPESTTSQAREVPAPPEASIDASVIVQQLRPSLPQPVRIVDLPHDATPAVFGTHADHFSRGQLPTHDSISVPHPALARSALPSINVGASDQSSLDITVREPFLQIYQSFIQESRRDPNLVGPFQEVIRTAQNNGTSAECCLVVEAASRYATWPCSIRKDRGGWNGELMRFDDGLERTLYRALPELDRRCPDHRWYHTFRHLSRTCSEVEALWSSAIAGQSSVGPTQSIGQE